MDQVVTFLQDALGLPINDPHLTIYTSALRDIGITNRKSLYRAFLDPEDGGPVVLHENALLILGFASADAHKLVMYVSALVPMVEQSKSTFSLLPAISPRGASRGSPRMSPRPQDGSRRSMEVDQDPLALVLKQALGISPADPIVPSYTYRLRHNLSIYSMEDLQRFVKDPDDGGRPVLREGDFRREGFSASQSRLLIDYGRRPPSPTSVTAFTTAPPVARSSSAIHLPSLVVYDKPTISPRRTSIIATELDAITCISYPLTSILLAASGLQGQEGRDVVDVIISLLRTFGHDTSTIEAVFRLIYRLVPSEGKGCIRLVGKDLCGLVVAAMRDSAVDRGVQCAGCLAMASLARLETALDGSNKVAIISAGGLEVVLEAMRAFADDGAVQSSAMAALASLHGCEGSWRACELVLSAMQRLASDEQVQTHGCRLLRAVASYKDENGDSTGASPACHLVVAALKVFPTSDVLVKEALCVMSDLIELDMSNRSRLAAAGACELLLAILQILNQLEKVRDIGPICRLLAEFANDSENHERLVGAGACERIPAAMTAFPASRDIQLWACDVAAKLCCNEAVGARLASAGTCRAVMATLKAYRDDQDIQRHGCRALVCLTVYQDASALAPAAAGELVLAAMQRFAHDVDIQESCCMAMLYLCQKSEEGKAALRDAGAGGLVEAAVERFPGLKDIAKETMDALGLGDAP